MVPIPPNACKSAVVARRSFVRSRPHRVQRLGVGLESVAVLRWSPGRRAAAP